jgi:DNA processing protein
MIDTEQDSAVITPHEVIGFLPVTDEKYPLLLKKRLGDKAPDLWYLGNLDLLSDLNNAVTLTGARASTGYGEHVAMDFAAGLVSRGYTTITGGAYGIDGMATRATLACGGNTIVVAAGGLDSAYPSGHSELFRRVAQQGLLLSEAPPKTVPTRERFLKRSKLMANLSVAVVVIEAGYRSGSINVAKHALKKRRAKVGAVPGPITSGTSAGTHELIKRGANLITSVADVIEMLGRE